MEYGYLVGSGSFFVQTIYGDVPALTRDRKDAKVFDKLPNVELAHWTRNGMRMHLYKLNQELVGTWKDGKPMDDDRMIVIWDLDETLGSIDNHRRQFLEKEDWESFFSEEHAMQDAPIEEICTLNRLCASTYNNIVLTARKEYQRDFTERWLQMHGIDYSRLIMQPDGCLLPGAEFKRTIVRGLGGAATIALAFEDQVRNVAMFREEGIRTCAVAANEWKGDHKTDDSKIRATGLVVHCHCDSCGKVGSKL